MGGSWSDLLCHFEGSLTDFYPVNSRCPEMDKCQTLVESDLISLAVRLHDSSHIQHDNLTQKERAALRELERDTSITIRNSNKGGLMVVMNTEMYRLEALHPLINTDTYIRLKGDSKYKSIMATLVRKGVNLGIFSNKEAEVFNPKHPILPTFHHLPKTHKEFSPLQGRPIIPGIGSLNEQENSAYFPHP